MVVARIAHKHAVFSLAKLYAKMLGKLGRTPDDAELRQKLAEVASVIRMLDPAYDVASVRPRRSNQLNGMFPNGGAFRFVLGLMREAGEPLTTLEIGRRICAAKGVEPTKERLKAIRLGILTSLPDHEGKSVQCDRSVRPHLWKLIK